ncbi:PhzF family phenazine biosynthesis protein [Halovenus sp. WSH3]|uniref:PhzF family phenazine biosynthesis protein n=1 Tax=Halovenus carboxidivorans TaxID=2692199 RepID=A0A6B0T6C6_9EURY|nr:PhzF family phenazine biosynthesis protein [Halovenus carboxidivorans]MXR50832.1 PhzF family phenazine biosynthesis protein [Halovenus carboxidivorans]
MQRREVLLVDAFADEPTGGRPVAVDPTGSMSASQRGRAAGEFGTSGVVSLDGETIEYADWDGAQAVVAAATAGAAGLYNRGALEPGAYELAVAGETDPAGPFGVELDKHGTVTVDVPTATPEFPAVDTDWIADAIGVDVAALEDVGADLPIARVGSFGGTLLVAVNFLEHLSGATPDTGTVAHLLDDADASRLVAFTFDTLAAETDVHARVFDPEARGCERGASGVGVAACTAHLADHAVFDGERDEIAVESGLFLDRPSTVRATVEREPSVGGTALTSLDGSLAVPEDDDDGIIEV